MAVLSISANSKFVLEKDSGVIMAQRIYFMEFCLFQKLNWATCLEWISNLLLENCIVNESYRFLKVSSYTATIKDCQEITKLRHNFPELKCFFFANSVLSSSATNLQEFSKQIQESL